MTAIEIYDEMIEISNKGDDVSIDRMDHSMVLDIMISFLPPLSFLPASQVRKGRNIAVEQIGRAHV